MDHELKKLGPRPLTDREASWIREILETNEEWKDADISKTHVVAQEQCDEGLSIVLQAPEPENQRAATEGYIGRLWIKNNDGSIIEIRLNQSAGRLQELFVLFVDPKNPRRTLPKRWTEISHQALKM